MNDENMTDKQFANEFECSLNFDYGKMIQTFFVFASSPSTMSLQENFLDSLAWLYKVYVS